MNNIIPCIPPGCSPALGAAVLRVFLPSPVVTAFVPLQRTSGQRSRRVRPSDIRPTNITAFVRDPGSSLRAAIELLPPSATPSAKFSPSTVSPPSRSVAFFLVVRETTIQALSGRETCRWEARRLGRMVEEGWVPTWEDEDREFGEKKGLRRLSGARTASSGGRCRVFGARPRRVGWRKKRERTGEVEDARATIDP